MKREVASRNTDLLVEVVPPSPRMDAAARINYYHRISREAGTVAIKAAIAAGVELVKVQLQNPGRLFDAWVDANCEFARRTAFKYMSVMKQTIGNNLGLLLEGSDETRRDAIEAFAASTDSKSLTELYVDLGIVKKTPSNLGGRREGAGRKPKLSDEELRRQAEALAADPQMAYNELKGLADGVGAFVGVRDGLGLLTTEHLWWFHGELAWWTKRCEALMAARKGKAKIKP